MNAFIRPSEHLPSREQLVQPNLRLRVGEHVVDVGALRVLTRPECPRLTGKSMAVLLELVRHSGDTVTRDQLLERVWRDRVTTPDVLTQAIKELRRAFLDDAKPSRYIETIPKVGYRLLAPVSVLNGQGNGAGLDPGAESVRLGETTDVDAPPVDAHAASARSPRTRLLWLALGALIVVAVVATIVPMLRTPPHGFASTGWRASQIQSLTSDPGSERRPNISPDGARVAYAHRDTASGFDRIELRDVGTSQSVHLTKSGSAHEETPAWSPDGSRIAFERLTKDTCTLFVATIAGATEHEVAACRDYTLNYFDWTPDGKKLITAEHTSGTAGNVSLITIDIASGTKEALNYARTAEDQDLEAHYSPDGRWIAFRRGLAPYSDLCVMAASGGEVRELTKLASRIRGFTWTADSGGLIFSSNHEGSFALYTIDLADSHIHELNVGAAEYPNAARQAQRVVYQIPRTTNRLEQAAVSAQVEEPELLAESTGSDGSPAWSPRSDRVAFVSDRSGAQQIWLYDFASETASELTNYRDAVLANPEWSSDGEHLLVTVRRPEVASLVEITPATHEARVVSKPGENVLYGSYGASAGSYLLVIGASGRHNQFVLIEHTGTDQERQTLLASAVEHVELDANSHRVYFTRNSDRGLFSRDLYGSADRFETSLIESSQTDGWRVVDGRIWFIPRNSWKPTDIREYDPVSGLDRTVARIDTTLLDVNFSVSPKRDRVVLAPIGTEDTDVGSFQLDASND